MPAFSPPDRHEHGRTRDEKVDTQRDPAGSLSYFLAIQALPAFDTEAVPSQVVVTARWTDETAGWIGLQPAFAFASVPDTVLGTKHPTPSLAIEDGEVAHCQTEGPRLKAPRPALLHEVVISRLGLGEWIDSHAQSIARDGVSGPGSAPAPINESHPGRRSRAVESATAEALQHASHHNT
jgi:hypothetical protein